MAKSKNQTFGTELRQLRRSDPRGLNLLDVAQEIGVSVSYLSDIERDARMPFGADKLRLLLAFLRKEDELDRLLLLAAASRRTVEISCEKYPEGLAALAALARRTADNDLPPDFWNGVLKLLGERKDA